jgi:hypothetical protein
VQWTILLIYFAWLVIPVMLFGSISFNAFCDREWFAGIVGLFATGFGELMWLAAFLVD